MANITCTKCGTVFPDRSQYATHQNAGCQGRQPEKLTMDTEGRVYSPTGEHIGTIEPPSPPKDHLIPWQHLPSECNALGPGQYAGLRLMGRLTKEGFVVDDASLMRGRR